MTRLAPQILLTLAALLGACGGGDDAVPADAPSTEAPADEASTDSEDSGLADGAKETAAEAWDRVKELYASAKEKGETASGDVAEWVVEDLRKVGAWDYLVVTLPQAGDEQLSEQLTKLGHERWDCYFVQDRGGNHLRMFMKRKRRSHIDVLIDRDVTRLAPVHEDAPKEPGAGSDDPR